MKPRRVVCTSPAFGVGSTSLGSRLTTLLVRAPSTTLYEKLVRSGRPTSLREVAVKQPIKPFIMASSSNSVAAHGWTSVPRDPRVLLSGKANLHEPKSLLVKDIKFPSDSLVLAVQEYAQQRLTPQTYNHSMRVYYFASAILQQQFPDQAEVLSPATLAVSALLHDIGTTHENLRATQMSFEFYGGMLALNLLEKQLGAPQSQAEAVAETIIRHQDLGETGNITFLGQLIQLATIYDNMGGNPGLVHADTKVDVNQAFPRNGWSRCFAATIREEIGLKPWAHTTALGEEDFPNGVLNNKLMAEFE